MIRHNIELQREYDRYVNEPTQDNIIKENNKIYLWVYKKNIAAITLYKKLGFNIKNTTENRYYMEYKKDTQAVIK